MKKNILYIAIAVIVGLIGGWLIFGGVDGDSKINSTTSDATTEQMWTCSMHPQILQPEPGDCPICGMDLVPAETGATGMAANEIRMTDNAMALANIQTIKVGSSSIEDENTVSLSGKIMQNEEASSVQASYFDGRIERLNINFEGQEIRSGQLLATIYAPNLVAAQQELITAASLKESQPALYKAVRNKLKLWKLSESQINSIEKSAKVQENFPIYATVSGTVSEVMARAGDYVKQGAPILKVSNLNTVWAEFDAYENQVSLFKIGQRIKVATNAYPNKEFDAEVSFIDPILDAMTRTVTVRTVLKNKDGLFKPGMFVTGKIEGLEGEKTSGEQLSVPASAVLWTGERSLVYIKTQADAPIFEMREVTISNRLGEDYIVSSGLYNGDEIVVNGTFTVDAAAQLQGKRSMMNRKKENATPLNREMRMKLPPGFQVNFVAAVEPYLKLKDAFVSSNATTVSKYAKELSILLTSMNTKGIDKMLESHIIMSIERLMAMVENNQLENQRDHFVVLNENLIAIAMNMDSIDSPLYIQRCPMANNNKGAIWISKEREVRNPYYGDMMLGCGEVVGEIK